MFLLLPLRIFRLLQQAAALLLKPFGKPRPCRPSPKEGPWFVYSFLDFVPRGTPPSRGVLQLSPSAQAFNDLSCLTRFHIAVEEDVAACLGDHPVHRYIVVCVTVLQTDRALRAWMVRLV